MSTKRTEPGISDTQALAAEMRIVVGKLIRKLREQSQTENFTWSQTSVIVRIEANGPATIAVLAAAEGVRPQSMGATIAGLEELGMVSRSPNPADGRETIVALTPRCREQLRSSRAAREDWLFRAIGSKFNASEQKQFARTIDLLKRLLDV